MKIVDLMCCFLIKVYIVGIHRWMVVVSFYSEKVSSMVHLEPEEDTAKLTTILVR
jgi:hypothetical protein